MGSEVLGRPVQYNVYLPPDYETSRRYYPIVYLLHGHGGDETVWLQYGEIDRMLDHAIAAGELPPMILVMPDGGVSFYTDDYQGETRWETMFLEEFIPHIEQAYRVREGRQFRGIGGISMGGFGALHLAMRNPELFAATAAFSPAVITDEQVTQMLAPQYAMVFGPVFGNGLQGEDRLTDHWRRYSVLDLVERTSADSLKQVRYYVDIGDDDFLAAGNAMLHLGMTRKQVPHEYRVRDGGHEWSYWRGAIPAGLAFIGESFRR
jgi:S-formylglutathione hydrolase FrmB